MLFLCLFMNVKSRHTHIFKGLLMEKISIYTHIGRGHHAIGTRAPINQRRVLTPRRVPQLVIKAPGSTQTVPIAIDLASVADHAATAVFVLAVHEAVAAHAKEGR